MLRGDIGHACRRGRRTALITGANSGALRLFCAQHVLDEVLEHSEAWASALKVPHDMYLARWADEYLPLIRTIQKDGLPYGLLGPSELDRIRLMGNSKDVPSIALSLALGAFYLTEDRAARNAVYGVDVDLEERQRWLRVLMDGGDADELSKVLYMAFAVPTLAVGGAHRDLRGNVTAASLLVSIISCGLA